MDGTNTRMEIHIQHNTERIEGQTQTPASFAILPTTRKWKVIINKLSASSRPINDHAHPGMLEHATATPTPLPAATPPPPPSPPPGSPRPRAFSASGLAPHQLCFAPHHGCGICYEHARRGAQPRAPHAALVGHHARQLHRRRRALHALPPRDGGDVAGAEVGVRLARLEVGCLEGQRAKSKT